MFEFTFDDFPTQTLEIENAEISIFAGVPPWRERIGLYVLVVAKEKDLQSSDAGESYLVRPAFYTEWLTIPVGELKSKRLDLLDGYRMIYNFASEEEDGFDQHPGAVYQGSHAPFTRATMLLTHEGGRDYRVQAEGATEFGWTFKIDAKAVLASVTAKSDRDSGTEAPSEEVSDWFEKHFDARDFAPTWSRKGNDDFGWYVFEAMTTEN